MKDNEINKAISEATGIVGNGFCFDQNAMHRAEHTLKYEDLLRYTYELAEVIGLTRNRNNWDYYWFVNISARQRAEAFLKTIGKWKD